VYRLTLVGKLNWYQLSDCENSPPQNIQECRLKAEANGRVLFGCELTAPRKLYVTNCGDLNRLNADWLGLFLPIHFVHGI
jgi:hypothetical protein